MSFRLDPMQLYGEVQEQLGCGMLILEVHSENYKSPEKGTGVTIRFIWFPAGEIKPGEPMADISTLLPKYFAPKYDELASQLTPNMKAAVEEKFPGTLSKSTNNQAHQDHQAELDENEPPESSSGL